MEVYDFTANGGVVTDINGVPEKYRGLYVEGSEDGQYVLSDAAKPLVADYVGVTASLAGIRQEKKKVTDENAQRRLATQAVEEFATGLGLEIGEEGVTAALNAFVTDLQEQIKGGKQMKVDIDKIRSDFDRRLSEAVAAKDAEIAERDGALGRYMIGEAATAALAKHKGSVDLLLPHVRNRAEVIREDNGEYTVRIKDDAGSHRMDGSGGWMGIDGLVAEMKTQDSFARAFESEVPAGTGARPGSMQRPAPRQDAPKTARDKIRSGLQKGQYTDGRGSGAVA